MLFVYSSFFIILKWILITFSEEKVLHLTPEQEKDKTHFTDREVSLNYFMKFVLKICDELLHWLFFNLFI